MKVLSLFSGIGAFEKALTNLEIPYELIGFSEIDKHATKSYCAIHGVDESKNLGDITKVDETKLPKDIDLVTYGFPCQDISCAGKQKGLINEDGSQTRSGLFFEALRIIESTRPKIAIAENVKNLISKKFNAQFQVVLASLEAAGYNNYWKVLNARDFGVPQNRERVFIVSIRKDIDTGLFEFPKPFPLEKRLKDALEERVDEKYYISNSQYGSFVQEPQGAAVKVLGFITGKNGRFEKHQSNTVYDADGVCPTQYAGQYRDPFKIKQDTRVAVAMRGRYSKAGSVEQHIEISDREYANTITTVQKDSLIGEPQVLRQVRTEYGKKIRKQYDSGELQEKWCNMKQLEPRTDGIANTLTTVQKDNYVVTVERCPLKFLTRNQKRIEGDYAFCIDTAHTGGIKETVGDNFRIRKLTPKECFRLMGFDDESFHKAEAVNSNTQLYKQAGNSIVVSVVEYIIRALLDCETLETEKEE